MVGRGAERNFSVTYVTEDSLRRDEALTCHHRGVSQLIARVSRSEGSIYRYRTFVAILMLIIVDVSTLRLLLYLSRLYAALLLVSLTVSSRHCARFQVLGMIGIFAYFAG